MALTAAGEVADYDETRKGHLGTAVKDAAGLGQAHGVAATVDVVPASVKINVQLSIPDGTGSGADAAVASLNAALGTPAQATALLNVTVMSVLITDTSGITGDADGGGGATPLPLVIATATVGAAVLLGGALALWRCRRGAACRTLPLRPRPLGKEVRPYDEARLPQLKAPQALAPARRRPPRLLAQTSAGAGRSSSALRKSHREAPALPGSRHTWAPTLCMPRAPAALGG